MRGRAAPICSQGAGPAASIGGRIRTRVRNPVLVGLRQARRLAWQGRALPHGRLLRSSATPVTKLVAGYTQERMEGHHGGDAPDWSCSTPPRCNDKTVRALGPLWHLFSVGAQRDWTAPVQRNADRRAHRDRLTRFGYAWFEHVAPLRGCELLVLNQQRHSPEQEMVQDMMTIVHCFSSRLYG